MTPVRADLPICRVVVMEDRAQVERSGEVEAAGPLTRFEVPALSPVAVDRSLRVEVQGLQLIDARVVRRWRPEPVPAAGSLAARVRALEDELAAHTDAAARLDAQVAVVAGARADLLRAIAQGVAVGRADAAAWSQHLATLDEARARVDDARRAAARDVAAAESRLAEARAAHAAAETPPHVFECALALTVAGAGRARVRAAYLVPCAVWRPAYRASLRDGRVLLEADAVIWQRTGERWEDVALACSTARPALGTRPPALAPDLLTLRAKSAAESRAVTVDLREEAIAKAGEGGTSEMPGLDDGGEARLLAAADRVTVRDDGQPHRIALRRFEAEARLELVCPAELTPAVATVARLPNAGGQPLLAGPVDLVRTGGFVGRTSLPYAAPGETMRLSFGAEDGLRVVRSVEDETSEARLTGRRTRVRTVALFVSNLRPEPARLVIEERVPVSEVEEVTVELLRARCQPAPAEVSRDGIARLEIDVGPRTTRECRFVWQLSAAAKVEGL